MSDAAVEALIAPDGALFFGHPEQVAVKIIRLNEQLGGVDRFELHAAHVDHGKTMKSIELFATEVVPLVRAELGPKASGRSRPRFGLDD